MLARCGRRLWARVCRRGRAVGPQRSGRHRRGRRGGGLATRRAARHRRFGRGRIGSPPRQRIPPTRQRLRSLAGCLQQAKYRQR